MHLSSLRCDFLKSAKNCLPLSLWQCLFCLHSIMQFAAELVKYGRSPLSHTKMKGEFSMRCMAKTGGKNQCARRIANNMWWRWLKLHWLSVFQMPKKSACPSYTRAIIFLNNFLIFNLQQPLYDAKPLH